MSPAESGGGPWAGPNNGAPLAGGGNTPGPLSCAGADIAHDAQRHTSAHRNRKDRQDDMA